MFNILYKNLEDISKANNNCKIVVGKQIVKRFAYSWHTGKEQYCKLEVIGTFFDYVIKAENTEDFEQVKSEVLKLVDVKAI